MTQAGLGRLARDQGMATPLWVVLGLQSKLTGGLFPPTLEKAIRPRAFVMKCFESLDMSEVVLALNSPARPGLREWLYALSAPDVSNGLAALRRHLFPGVAQLLGAGEDPEKLPGLPQRVDLALRRLWFMTRTLCHQTLRLMHRFD